MKKSLLTSVFALILLLLAACGSDGVNSTPSTEPSSAEQSETSDDGETKDYSGDGYTMKIIENGNNRTLEYTPDTADRSAAPTYLPFDNLFDNSAVKWNYRASASAGWRAEISYRKREGGSYIYSNNPEMFAADDLGQAIIRNENLTGSVMFTYEHSNRTGKTVYFGYQLLNESDTDAVIEITNAGMQVDGEWLGQRSWSDYFSTRFELPDDYYIDGVLNPIYVGCDFIDYTPTVFDGVTVTVPAGEYIYVLGGTSADAYGNLSVNGTADKPVYQGRCSNGAVKFNVASGSVTGTFYVYSDASQVKAKPDEQGIIVERNGIKYGAQYKGIERTAGLIEADITFLVNDKTPSGKLGVKYSTAYDTDSASKTSPYEEYTLGVHSVAGNTWFSSINPNNSHDATGADMMTFECVDSDGTLRVIDNAHADGRGKAANTGNWMVQYTDNFTLINVGDTERTFRIYKKGSVSGALMTMVRKPDGSVLDAKLICHPYYYADGQIPAGVDKSLLVEHNGNWWYTIDGVPYYELTDEKAFVWEVTVAPHSAERISVDYLIMGNSCGGITHWVSVD